MLKRGNDGFTLVEVMVALALGTVLLAGLLQLFAALVDMNARLLRQQRLHETLQGLMAIMVRDLARAGYQGGGTPPGAPNPFSGRLTRGVHCVLYRYDLDGDGALDNDERAGFKLAHGALLAKRRDRHCGTGPCRDCGSGRWWRLSDPDAVRITTLRFSESLRRAAGSDHRSLGLEIVLEGALRHFPAERLALRARLWPPNIVLGPP